MKKLLHLTSTVFMAVLISTFIMALEEPEYSLLARLGVVEFRLYAPYLTAETLVTGESDQSKAASQGFRRLFSHISGNNQGKQSISMTAPVQQQPVSRKIAMTVPVQQMQNDEGWLISFVVPRDFDFDTVPIPGSPEVKIRAVPERLMAVLPYTGRWTTHNRQQHTRELLETLEKPGVEVLGPPVYASYNSPFSLPMMRRNEIMVEVASTP